MFSLQNISKASFSSSIIFNGNRCAKRILSDLKKDIQLFSECMKILIFLFLISIFSEWSLSRLPSLSIINVGNNQASLSYIKKKQ